MLKRIGVLSGGGDCPGINAVIRAVTLDATAHGTEVVGIKDGFLGLIEDRSRPLIATDVAEILTTGGSILGCSNKANPSAFATGKDAAGRVVFSDVRARCWETITRCGIDALVVIGGDGTMQCAQGLIAGRSDFNIVGIPKTIDNDIPGTEMSFGFLTAVETATQALDRVQNTAASHHRAIVVEVMGRHAGWIALFAGIASGSHMILIPEIPFEPASVAAAVRRRCDKSGHAVVCVAEGARSRGGMQSVLRTDPTAPDPVKLGGISVAVSNHIEAVTGIDSRNVILGHVQRGGPPTAADRVVATQFGQHAMQLLRDGARHRMVARQNFAITDVSIAEAAAGQRLIPVRHPLIAAARGVGVEFGDEAQ